MGKTLSTGFLNDTVHGIKINSSIKCNANNYNNNASRTVSYVIIHYTGNSSDKAINNAKYYNNSGARRASAHFFVDEKEIYQSVELRDTAWHIGCKTGYKTAARNANAVGIEMCCSGNYTVSEKTKENAAYLAAHLCKMIGITADKVDTYVLRHYDCVKSGKQCPRQFVKNPKEWTEFKNKVKSILKGSTTSVKTESSKTTTNNSKFVYGGLDYSPVFDPMYYATANADVRKVYGTNSTKLFEHFTKYGMKEGRVASSNFNVKVYKAKNPDLKVLVSDYRAYFNHYIQYGKKEKRVCK